MKSKWLIAGVVCVMAALVLALRFPVHAGEVPSASGYTVLAPIRHGNLTVFPVVAAKSHDTEGFLTLDEGLKSGEVMVAESGSVSPLVRPRHPRDPAGRPYGGGAQVNQLVLVNNSKRPLILLAGEVVTGGKQDRVIAKDRIVPAESDPIDSGRVLRGAGTVDGSVVEVRILRRSHGATRSTREGHGGQGSEQSLGGGGQGEGGGQRGCSSSGCQ